MRPEEWADVKYEIVEQRTFQAQRTEVMCAPRWKKLATFKKLKIKETRNTEEKTGEKVWESWTGIQRPDIEGPWGAGRHCVIWVKKYHLLRATDNHSWVLNSVLNNQVFILT